MTPAARLTRAVVGLVLLALATLVWLRTGFQVFAVGLPAAVGLLYLVDSLVGQRLFAQGYAWTVLFGWLCAVAVTLFSLVFIVAIAAGWFSADYPISAVMFGLMSAALSGYVAVSKFSFVRNALSISESAQEDLDRTEE
jgi:hypothetical protein